MSHWRDVSGDVEVKFAHYDPRMYRGASLYDHHGDNGDAIEFPDGIRVHILHLAPGTRVWVGEKKKRDLNKVLNMDHIRADVPRDVDSLTPEEKAEYDDYIREVARDDAAEVAWNKVL
jgi:hypothetical protein